MDIEREIINFINQEILNTGNIRTDTLLLQEGVIDSLTIARLISFLERKYSVVFSQQDIIVENFLNVQTLCEFIRQNKGMVK